MTVMDFPSSPINGQTTTDGRYYFDSSVGSTGAWRSTPLPVGGLPAGSIIQWGSGTLPANWLLCDGSAVSRSTYSSLFAAIGTQYGAGDGTTTFNLPDIPNGDTSGIVANVRINSQVTVTTTNTDLSGVTVNAQLRAGRTYRISFSSPNLNASAVGRARFDLLSNGALIARDYVGIPLNVGGVAFNIQTLYSPPSDGTYTFKVQGMVDFGSATTMTVYADGNSTTLLTVEDMGEASGSSLRQRPIIKASAGWTAGDSELATRLGVVEQRQILSPNYVINGGFDIWQRGTSAVNGIANAAFHPDRWLVITDGVGTVNSSRIDVASQGIGSQYGWRLERTAGTSRWVGIHMAEGALAQVGKTVTLSVYLRKGSALTTNVVLDISTRSAKFGAVADSRNVTIPNSSISTTSFTRFSVSLPVTTATSSANADLFEIEIVAASQAGASNAFLDIAGVQLEDGTIPTPFRRNAPSIQAELAACQRYYYRLTAATSSNGYPRIATGYVLNGTTAEFLLKFPVPMRTIPYAFEASAGTTFCTYNSTSGVLRGTSIVSTMADSSNEVGHIQLTISGAMTMSQSIGFLNYSGTTSYVGWNAEL